ncbi:N-6 DNA methylase [bacterium]|nr:N-6 DNA methylase [bacterium]MBU1984089.1 N-6 DNA methylase [bacterium]
MHTYYAMFMKLLVAEIASQLSPLGTSILQRLIGAESPAALRTHLSDLEQGGIWRQYGLTNFLEGDLFTWYIDAWDDRLAEALWNIVHRLDAYEPTSLSVDPEQSRDLLKQLYHRLFPRSVRHDLGEYYTPDWLAEFVLDELGYDGNPDVRVLDPACGSGTFLVAAIKRAKSWYDHHRFECGYGQGELLFKLQRNVVGFDLNPLAVMAARANYLLSVLDLFRYVREVEIPVYLCDSVVIPSEYGGFFKDKDDSRSVKTAEGWFQMPTEIAADRSELARYTEVIEDCVLNDHTADEFLKRCASLRLPTVNREIHVDLYDKLHRLKKENKNGIWARLIKNNFAPLFLGKVDLVVGNPPWVNWESLPDEYRAASKSLWERYRLFTLSGTQARLGGGKKDLSMLFTHCCVDHYLDYGGKLGFVITQTVFKTKGAGEGFRGLKYFRDNRPVVLKPLSVHDLSAMQVFEGATNRTAVFLCEKQSENFSYPVQYDVWRGPSRINPEAPLEDVLQAVYVTEMAAEPIQKTKKGSPWLTVPREAIPGIRKIIGKSDYVAYEGVNTGGLNGCYWIEILRRLLNKDIHIRNLHNVGKIKVEEVEAVIEPDLVYPLLRGRDVHRWIAEPSAHIILAQDPDKGKGIAESKMRVELPKTYAYLKRFEGNKKNPQRGTLRGRALYRKYFKDTDPFYSMYNVGSYTLAKWKVMWPEVGYSVRAAVCGPQRDDGNTPILPAHTLVFVSLKSAREAYYVCGLLNSCPAQALLRGYIALHPSPHVLELLNIPRFDNDKSTSVSLSDLSRRCHSVAAGDKVAVRKLEDEIDRLAAKLWGITDSELTAIQEALADLEGTGETEFEEEEQE